MKIQVYKHAQALLRHHAAVSLLGNGAAAGLGLLITGLLARWLPREAFGSWMLFLTSYTLFDTLRTGLLLNGLIRHVADLRPDSDGAGVAFGRWVGAVWQLGLAFTGLTSLLLVGLSYGLPGLHDWTGSAQSALWFGIISLVSLPSGMATWFLQARARFGPLQWVRILTQAAFLLLIGSIQMTQSLTLPTLFGVYALANGVVSVWTLANGWSRLSDLHRGTRAERQPLLHFGKYSIGTLVGANLLRSADTLLLGAVLGPAAVAVYAIPQRLTQLLDLPVRSVAVTAMPRLATLHRQGEPEALRRYFERSAGLLWLALLPVSVLGFVCAEPLVTLLGGGTYREGAAVMRCFMVYGALLPLDRYSGVGLDAIGKPRANLLKVLVMLGVQVGGATVALLGFGSVTALACVASFTFATGMGLGFWWLGRYVPVSLVGCIRSGWADLINLTNRFRHERLRTASKSLP